MSEIVIYQPRIRLRILGSSWTNTLQWFPTFRMLFKQLFFKIREISYYCKFLSSAATKTLVHAYVTSRLDYCNGLLYGLPKDLTNKLQSVLNTAARLVSLSRKYDNITPILKELHWLHIQHRIKFKLLLQVFKCLNDLAPKYLADKLTLNPQCGLRSDNQNLLFIPKSRLVLYGDRAFSIAAHTMEPIT